MDEKEISNTQLTKTIVYTSKFKIVGYIHLLFKDSYRGRLSDHLNAQHVHTFIPITDAEIFDGAGKLIQKTKCIIINKNQIEAIIELDEEE